MNTPTPVQQVETGLLAWLKQNYVAFGSGNALMGLIWYVVHKVL